MTITTDFHRYPPDRPPLVWALALAAALSLAACDRNKNTATQTAAKVNKEEITVHQINFVLGQQRAVPAEQAASSSRQVLERLIDQELVLQKAAEQKLDRDPRVAQQVEAARRDALVRAYIDRISQGAPKPTPQEVAAYYAAHPALFAGRKLYNLREVSIDASPEQVATLESVLANSASFVDFLTYLKDNSIKFTGADVLRPAEQLPLADVDRFASMKDGQSVLQRRPGGAHVVTVVQSRPQPVSPSQATVAIEQFLLNERKRKLVADDLQAMRAAAKIEYVGQFAVDAAKAPYQPPIIADPAPVKTLAPTLPASAVTAAPQLEVNRPGGASGPMPSGETLEKGLKGMR